VRGVVSEELGKNVPCDAISISRVKAGSITFNNVPMRLALAACMRANFSLSMTAVG